MRGVYGAARPASMHTMHVQSRVLPSKWLSLKQF
jgi:hypothetical protein